MVVMIAIMVVIVAIMVVIVANLKVEKLRSASAGFSSPEDNDSDLVLQGGNDDDEDDEDDIVCQHPLPRWKTDSWWPVETTEKGCSTIPIVQFFPSLFKPLLPLLPLRFEHLVANLVDIL